MKYLTWNEKTLTDVSESVTSPLYGSGYVFTRVGKGVMQQTRSVRIRLKAFAQSSENRRIMKKAADLSLEVLTLPLGSYDFTLAKMAKDFYAEKFGPGIMSAQKIKEMLTDPTRSNFNLLLSYSSAQPEKKGYAICYGTSTFLHYSYPFYALSEATKDMGLAMMLMAIDWAQKKGLEYVYLGSLQRPSDTYKLQFSGLEWFTGTTWSSDTEAVKKLLISNISTL